MDRELSELADQMDDVFALSASRYSGRFLTDDELWAELQGVAKRLRAVADSRDD
jgi:hypothetical protein